jgi:hypothetical protein
MSVIFPNTASLLFRQESSPWYNGFNAPGSGSDGVLTFDNMDFNWYYLNSASYQTIAVIKGAAYTGSSNTFTEPQTFISNVGISGSLTGSMANFSGQVISSYPGVGFYGTASWAANAITSSVLVITSSISASYASASTSASLIYITASQTNADYTLVFKNSTGALPNYYQLAADDTNGPYYNPSTNVLGGLGGLTVSASKGVFTSITGSLLGNVIGTASFATSASYTVTASYASNGVTNLAVGTFYDTNTQTILSGASASLQLNTPVIQDGVIVASNSRITVSRTGIYNLQFSAQLSTPGGGSPDVHIWLRKNGINVANSNTGVVMQNSNQKHVAAWNFVESLIAGDYLELVAYLNGGSSVLFLAEAAGPTNGGVGVPSMIVTMTQIK